MSKKIVSQGFALRCERVHLHIKKVRKHGTHGNLHDLRVAIKQMDALYLWYLCFLEAPDAQYLTDWFDKLRPLYKKAGRLRTAQLLLKNGEKTGVWDVYPQAGAELRNNVVVMASKLTAFLKKYRFPSGNRVVQTLEKYNGMPAARLAEVRLALAYRHQQEALDFLETPPGELWHAARRFFKANYLLMQPFAGVKGNVLPYVVGQWADIEEDLGKWHDWTGLAGYLQPLIGDLETARLVGSKIRFYEQAVALKIGNLVLLKGE